MSTVDPDSVYSSPDLPPEIVYVAPDVDLDPVPESGAPQQEELLVFNPKSEEDFNGLLYLGRIEKTFRWANHSFTVRTLTTQDHLEIGQMIAAWKDTYAETISWQAAFAAAGTVSVDGKPVATPLSETENELAARFTWASKQYPWTIERIWNEILALEDRVRRTLVDMGKAGGDPESIPT